MRLCINIYMNLRAMTYLLMLGTFGAMELIG